MCAEKLENLKQETQKYSEVAAIEQEKAKPLLQELERLGKKGWRVHLGGLAISLLSGLIWFVLGIIFGPWVKSLLGMG